MGRYEPAYFCKHCKTEVSYNTMMYSHGMCPHCGHKGERAGTIMDVVEQPVYRPTFFEWIESLFKKKKEKSSQL